MQIKEVYPGMTSHVTEIAEK